MINQVSTTRQTAENTKPQDNTKHNAEVKDQRPELITPCPLTPPLSPTPESEEPETNEQDIKLEGVAPFMYWARPAYPYVRAHGTTTPGPEQ